MILCVAFFLFFGVGGSGRLAGGGHSLCYNKICNLNPYSKVFSLRITLLEKILRNTLFKPNYCSELDTTITFLLREILELLYCGPPFHTRTRECF